LEASQNPVRIIVSANFISSFGAALLRYFIISSNAHIEGWAYAHRIVGSSVLVEVLGAETEEEEEEFSGGRGGYGGGRGGYGGGAGAYGGGVGFVFISQNVIPVYVIP